MPETRDQLETIRIAAIVKQVISDDKFIEAIALKILEIINDKLLSDMEEMKNQMNLKISDQNAIILGSEKDMKCMKCENNDLKQRSCNLQ